MRKRLIRWQPDTDIDVGLNILYPDHLERQFTVVPDQVVQQSRYLDRVNVTFS